MEMASPYPGIQEVVRSLQKREVDLVIISSNSSEYILIGIKYLQYSTPIFFNFKLSKSRNL